MANAIDTLVWLGAGELLKPELLNGAAKAILVDAQQDYVKALNSKYAPQANVQVEHLVLAKKQGEAEFHQYNLPEYSALSQATGLKQLFPGIRLAQTSKVTTTAIDDFISKLTLDSDKTNLLVLDIIDQSLPLLQSLASAGLLAMFKQLQLPASNEPLYQGAATAAALTEFLGQHGYEVTNTDSSDPDLAVLTFSLNSLWQELVTSNKLRVTLEQQLKVEQSNKATLEQQLASDKQQAEQQQAEQAKQLEAAQQQLVKLTQQSEQEIAELQKQLAASKHQAASEQQQLTESSNKALAKAEQAVKNNTKLLQRAEDQKLQYEQKLADISKQLTNAVSEKEILQQQLSTVKVAAEKTKAELNGQITGMDAELKKALQQLQTADQQLSSVTEQAKKQQQQLLEKDSQLTQLNKTKTQLEQELKQETELNLKHKSWAESLKTQNEQLNKELKEQQRSAQLSIKLLAKVEADTAELRGRYSVLLNTEQELRNLVGELYVKLSAASKFYDKLEQDHPELLENK